MKVLVTGGAGFIGSHLSEYLLKRGESVAVVDELNDFYDPEIKRNNLAEVSRHGNLHFYQTDIRDSRKLAEIFELEKPEKVVHLAARAGVRPSLSAPLLYEEVNVIGTLHLLELCRKFPITNFVFASSSSVYGINSKLPFAEDDPIEKPVSPYATTKRSGELLVFNYSHLYSLPATCLRFFTVYGPRQRPEMGIHKFTSKILSGKEVEVYGDGQSRRDYTYIDDIVGGIVKALDNPKPFAIYNLGGSSPVTLTELIERIEEAAGVKAIRKYLPDQPGDVPVTYADICKAKVELGFEPAVDLKTGLARFVAWYREKIFSGK
ncbi:MAG: GDP-mannose 4,6-dehydratase [Blastocatellia bacterium]|nr:GDP-mannose 4,6-dehydratase [Blastocatellia bacterium]